MVTYANEEFLYNLPAFEDGQREHVGHNEDVFVFISLDLTNSTRFKREEPRLWPEMIALFYDTVFEAYGVKQYRQRLEQILSPVEFWKFVGDEVLLYSVVYTHEEIYSLVQATDQAVKKVLTWIAEKYKNKHECQSVCSDSHQNNCPLYQKHKRTCQVQQIIKESLGIKATLWIAACGKNNSSSRNIIHVTYTEYGLNQKETFDFLGPEIDEGFRIVKYAVKNRVVVSPFLANALYETTKADTEKRQNVENNFKIVSYQSLKGIWDERLFPIIMYAPIFANFYDRIEYDEIELPTYTEFKNNSDSPRCKIEYLSKILHEVHLEDQATVIINRLNDTAHKREEKLRALPIINELHVACACFLPEGKLLIHKHKERGWEFGCAKIRAVSTWKMAIANGYKEKYNLKIEVDDNPLPVATYIYRKTDQSEITALGIIVTGKVIDNESSLCSDDFRSVTEDDLDQLDGKSVERFVENAHRAFYIYRQSHI